MHALPRARKALLLLLAVFIFGVIVAGLAYDPNSAAAVFREKHARLQTLASPKIVLIGGSNLTYGLDSARVERELGIPVVNMAYSAGLGLRFQLEDILPEVRPRDIVVIIPAYEQFRASVLNGTGDVLNVLFYHPSSLNAITSWKQVRGIVGYLPSFLQTNFKKHVLSPIVRMVLNRPGNPGIAYTRADFNEQGDLLGYFRYPPIGRVEGKPLQDPAVDPEAIDVLHSFWQRATERGAVVVHIYPSYSRGSYELNRSSITEIDLALRTRTKIPIITKPEEYVFEDDLFFDNAYHLYTTGTQLRTERLVQHLAAFLAGTSTKDAKDDQLEGLHERD